VARKIKVKVGVHDLICEIVEFAAQRACNRHDKYSDKSLSEASRSLLVKEFEQSFWMAVGDHNVEFE
jgi:hypothetical protein